MEPLQIYYLALAVCLVFVLLVWFFYKFGSSLDLTLDPGLIKERSIARQLKIKAKGIERQQKIKKYFDTHDLKIVGMVLGAIFGGSLFFIGFSIYNIHARYSALPLSTIQVIGLFTAIILGSGITNGYKNKKINAVMHHRGLCFLISMFLLPSGIELSKAQNPHLFGSPYPRFLSFFFAVLLVGLGVKYMLFAIKNERTAPNQKIKRTS